jgi:hypothetical protein
MLDKFLKRLKLECDVKLCRSARKSHNAVVVVTFKAAHKYYEMALHMTLRHFLVLRQLMGLHARFMAAVLLRLFQYTLCTQTSALKLNANATVKFMQGKQFDRSHFHQSARSKLDARGFPGTGNPGQIADTSHQRPRTL